MNTVQHDSETPAQGQQAITACAFIYREENDEIEVFLPRRAKTKKFLPDVFELPGGHIDFGENIEAGLIREIKEEFDMAVSLGDPFAAFTYMNEVKGSHSVEVIYFAKFISQLSELKLHPDDHSEFVWAKKEDLPEIYSGQKGMDDIEAQKILRGFDLLKTSTT